MIGREDGANAEQHFGVPFLQIGAGVGNLVNLRLGFGGVQRIGAEQGLQHHFLLLHVGPEIDELEAALLEDAVHVLDLVGRKREPLHDHGVPPPHSLGADVEAALLAAESASHVAAIRHAGAAEVAGAVARLLLHHSGTHHSGAHLGTRRGLTLDGSGRSRGSVCCRRRRRLLGEGEGGAEHHGCKGNQGFGDRAGVHRVSLSFGLRFRWIQRNFRLRQLDCRAPAWGLAPRRILRY